MAAPELNPFQVGQYVECSTFTQGYRGAWFRCKILELRHGKIGLRLLVRYLDYDDKNYRHKLYQYVPGLSPRKKVMMVRPQYPQVHFNRAWQVGDHCEFVVKDAFWTAVVVDVSSEDTIKVACPKPPWGEGGHYNVKPSDMRPRLRWSVQNGWSVKPNTKADGPVCNVVESSDESETGVDRKTDVVKVADESEDGGSRVTEQPWSDETGHGGDDDDDDDEEYTQLATAFEELTDRLAFMRDVLNDGFHNAMNKRKRVEWEVASVEGNKLNLASNRNLQEL